MYRMHERQQQKKLPSAWQPDEWVCHHGRSRQSTITDDYHHEQSHGKVLATSRTWDSASSSRRISTAKLIERKNYYSTILFKLLI